MALHLRHHSRADTTTLAWSAAIWFLVASMLVGAGLFIARALDSALLGFLGADFLFLIAASLYTSGQGRSGRQGY